MRILSVDDNAQNLYLIESVGQARGFEVVSARNGLEALEQIDRQLPDLIISDILMPEMDGFQLCHELKSHERTRHIPFIFYTATYTAKQDEALAMFLGASRFIVKPMDPQQFVAVIAEVAGDAARGETAVPESGPGEIVDYLKAYNSRLVNKLDRKIEQLETARRAVQEMLEAKDREIAQRRQAEQERSKFEAQFIQAQKLESVGRLAGGIAHDFNNLLTVINGYSDLLLQSVQHSDPMRNGLEQILAAGKRAAKLTRQLLAFSRRQTIDAKALDLTRTVEAIRGMIERLVGDDVELVTKLSSAGTVLADEGQIHQVLMNLVVNARDAMPRGGRLEIATANVEAGAVPAAEGYAVQPGPYVLLSVTDNGTGMSRETLEHIFEPFFTTKAEGEGTGLGLATVYGIVRQSGGLIRVASEPGAGSTFRIYLPEHNAPETARQATRKPAEPTPAKETVLVVEDHGSVRSLMVSILKGRGYRVLEAGTGEQALALAERHAGTIDLVVTDVQMPGMDGLELAKQLRTRQPNLRVLLATGTTGGTPGDPMAAGPGVSRIGKPFGPESLAEKVREALDAGRAG